ncbi:MAG: hypothetical protein RMJ07_01700 [Nitrososphaerota archaeon]|nr:hypothetical protein [Candidatus Bathyarchaeota archaeon]MDW8048383.1 hypothetical protein [Nitrososphaerota archaeon]
MFHVEDIAGKTKDLERQRDKLVDELKNLEERRKKGELSEEAYKEKRRELERQIVEVMDRLAQMRFFSGET